MRSQVILENPGVDEKSLLAEMWGEVATNLNPKERCDFALTCRLFHQVASDKYVKKRQMLPDFDAFINLEKDRHKIANRFSVSVEVTPLVAKKIMSNSDLLDLIKDYRFLFNRYEKNGRLQKLLP